MEIKTWKEYCKLNSDSFEVYCFKAVGDVTKVQTMEDEEIEIFDIQTVFTQNLLSNLHWLIPLAWDGDNIYGQINYF